jgi:hypothetical protein
VKAALRTGAVALMLAAAGAAAAQPAREPLAVYAAGSLRGYGFSPP